MEAHSAYLQLRHSKALAQALAVLMANHFFEVGYFFWDG
jgi:hypothetical protein